MLTDAGIKALRAKDKSYKVADRDGMYVVVQPSGRSCSGTTIASTADADVGPIRLCRPVPGAGAGKAHRRRRAILDGHSPAQEKQQEKRSIKEARSFGQFGERWLQEARMADSTRAMRRAILNATSFRRSEPPVDRDHPGGSPVDVCEGEGARRAGHGRPRSGYREARLRLRHPAR